MADSVTTVSTLTTTVNPDGTAASSSQTQVQSNSGVAPQGGFCGAEERVSTHTCNSIHPSTTLDQFGNQVIVWHDNRDGNFEVYFRIFPSKMSTDEQVEASQVEVDSGTARDMRLECGDIDKVRFPDGESSSGFSGTSFDLTLRCAKGESGVSGFLARYSAGRLDVNAVSQSIFLQATGNANFISLGVKAGDAIRFETGRNAGVDLQVQEIIGTQLLKLAFDSRAVPDTGFLYSVIIGELSLQETCETRLTCDRGASMFPDVSSDEACRYHVLYHDDKSGSRQVYYVQVAPSSLIGQGCPSPPLNVSGFGEVPPSTIGSFRFVSSDPPTVRHFKVTGEPGVFFSYGNKLLPEPSPNSSGTSEEITGSHSLFRDFEEHGGRWVGISKRSDRASWNEQISENPIEPDVVYGDLTSLHEPGDFGGAFDFSNVGILAQSPPDMDVEVRTIGLPLIPKCAPDSPAQSLSRPRESDLVEAPKRPLPPTFVDPVDITSFLSSPMVQVLSDEPSRFTLESDKSGTVFTNIVIEDASGELKRLLFRQEEDGSGYKFVLGLSNCNGGPCAVKASRPSASDFLSEVSDGRFRIKLQVWKGSDYRIDPETADSASMAAEMVFEKEFFFDAGDKLSMFVLEPGELTMEAGRTYFFVPVATDSVEFMLKGIGNGNSVWTTDGSGTMSQYNVPFTVPPYLGMTVPVYYDGTLVSPPPQPNSIVFDTSNIMTIQIDPSIGTGAAVLVNAIAKPVGLDYNPVTNKLIVSHNYPSGNPFSLSQIDEDGVVTSFSTLSNVGGENILAIVKEPLEGSGWTEGDIVCSGTGVGNIAKISADGTVVQNPWVTIPDTGAFQGGLYFDRTGVFDGDLIAVSSWQNAPKVWRVKSDGSFSLLASINVSHLEGVITVPDEVNKYGPWAGKIIVGAELESGMYAIDKNGAVEFFPLPIRPEQMSICEEGTNLYISAFQEGKIYVIPASALKNSIGNIFIAQEANIPLVQGGGGGAAVFELKWNGQQFVTEAVFFSSHIEQINFNEARINPLNQTEPPPDTGGPCGTGKLEATYPKLITRSSGENMYPRMATSQGGMTWAVWHSTRDGSEDVYAARYFSDCNVWNSSATGGDDMRISSLAAEGRRALFPSVAVSARGEAHVVFQGTDPSDGKFEIYYSRTTGGGAKFLRPIRLTSSPGDAMMPDIAISYEDGNERVTVVWHDNRFGNFEVLAATKYLGKWRSSYQSGSDIRITNSAGNSMFPRLATDKDGNIRCVYHSTRTGRNEIFMSTYVGLTRAWDSSGTGGSDMKVSNGPLNSLFPDVATDKTGGVAAVWHDDRHTVENPDFHEEVYRTYCPKLGHPGGHFPPLVTNIEERLDVQFDVVDCVGAQPIDLTNVPEVCLRIKSPGATFWRAVNNDSGVNKEWSKWQQFKPTYDLDTTLVPWTLSCNSGVKEVCVQVQDSTMVGFPICKQVTLAIPPQDYKVEFFSDRNLSIPLPTFGDLSAAKEGDVFVRITAPTPQVLPPKFSVVGKGGHIVVNQETEPIFGSITGASGFFDANKQTARTTDSTRVAGDPSEQVVGASIDPSQSSSSTSLGAGSGASGASGIGSFQGVNIGGAFSAAAAQQFAGRFHVFKEDGLFHIDGLARVIVQPQGLCSNAPGSADKQAPSEECPNETTVPPGITPPDFIGTSGMSGPSGTAGPWIAGPFPSWMTVDLTSNDVTILPAINAVPYKLTIGAIAQPFILPANVSGDVTIKLKLARREVPAWLSSFSTRSVLVEIIKDFFSATPTVIAAKYVPAGDLPEVSFDPVTGLMTDPTSLELVDTVEITLTGVPTLLSGTDYAISIQDDTFYPLLGTYGANAKYFVVGVGSEAFTGAAPYYFRDY